MNFEKGEYRQDPGKSEEWNRGAYLVQGLGHCGTCHTPKNILGGDKNTHFLAGAKVENWWAPNITAENHEGIGRWSIGEIKDYLRTGVNRYDAASGPMAEEVINSSRHWKESDLQAVAVYLKSLKPGDSSQQKRRRPCKRITHRCRPAKPSILIAAQRAILLQVKAHRVSSRSWRITR
ncbi:cytochrome c [Apirhabdus apintestini]|nr:cytochrome c [Enterobacteriaceae bacterium CA-0114]